MNKPLYCLALAGLVAGLATPVSAAPEDDYVVFRTAAAINTACGGLKYLEHEWALSGAAAALNATREYRMSVDGRLSEKDYQAWAGALDAKVEATAAAVGCTQQAMPYINQAKGKASGETYMGLVLAVHFSNQPDVLQHRALPPDRMAAAQRYDGYLQALYGDRFPAFAEAHKQMAVQKLPLVNPLDSGFGLGMGMMSEADQTKLSDAQSRAMSTVNAVFFEVTAETAGFVVRPRTVDGSWTIPDLRSSAAPADPGYIVVDGPGYDLVDLTPETTDGRREELFRVVTLTPQNTLRVMYYGDAAALLANGTARLYIRTAPEPEGANSYTFFSDPGFRDGAVAFDGTPVSSGCLGSACFDFPADATAAFIAPEAGQYAEIFVSAQPNAKPAPATQTDSLKPGRASPFYARKLLAP